MKLSRIAAAGVVLLVLVHLIGQHLWLGESPVWFNDIFLIRLILFDGDRGVPFWAIGLGLSAAALLLAWLLWARQSSLAAIALLAAQGWEAWWRYQQIDGAIDRGHVVGTPLSVGAAMAALGLLVALLAVAGALVARGAPIPARG